jgi:dihydrofolate reductase
VTTDQEERDMARLIYSAIASLDGYVEDEQGTFDWAAPDDEVLAAVNDLERPIGTYLYGRRMYETMVFWETASTGADQSAGVRDFAELWRVAEKVVYSRTLQTATSARTRIEQEFDPGAARRVKETSVSDITVGGAELAGQAITASLVDECHLFLTPILVGGGKRALPDKVAHSASAPGRAPIRERRRPPPLPHQRLTNTAREDAGHAPGVDIRAMACAALGPWMDAVGRPAGLSVRRGYLCGPAIPEQCPQRAVARRPAIGVSRAGGCDERGLDGGRVGNTEVS